MNDELGVVLYLHPPACKAQFHDQTNNDDL